jgi:hypothetical protein
MKLITKRLLISKIVVAVLLSFCSARKMPPGMKQYFATAFESRSCLKPDASAAK